MKKLIFLYNELLDSEKRDLLQIPLTFISFGYIDGKLYKYKDTVMAIRNGTREWGNNKVYGALFTLDDYNFNIRFLDGMHVCSKSRIYINHDLDLFHRNEICVTPIVFNTLEEFVTLQYKELEGVLSYAFFGNVKQTKINNMLHNTNSQRIKDGLDKNSFKKLYKEVGNG